jgi:hypothetical protein
MHGPVVRLALSSRSEFDAIVSGDQSRARRRLHNMPSRAHDPAAGSAGDLHESPAATDPRFSSCNGTPHRRSALKGTRSSSDSNGRPAFAVAHLIRLHKLCRPVTRKQRHEKGILCTRHDERFISRRPAREAWRGLMVWSIGPSQMSVHPEVAWPSRFHDAKPSRNRR